MALVGWVRHRPGWGFVFFPGDSVITPARARGFANGFFLVHVWDVLLWSRNSRGSVSHRQVARDGGVEGLSRAKRRDLCCIAHKAKRKSRFCGQIYD